MERTRQRDHAVEVFDFTTLNLPILHLMISVWKIFANCSQAGAAVGSSHHFVWIEAVLNGPLPPHTRNGRSGVNQNAVKVEQQCSTEDFIHQERSAHRKLHTVLRF